MAFYPKYDYEVPELAKEVITGEAHTIPTVGDPVITLRHIPRQADGVTIAGFTEVTGPPGPGEFWVHYGPIGFGRIEFNEDDAGTPVSVDYVACGTVVLAETYPDGREGINAIQEAIDTHVTDEENPHNVDLEQARQAGATMEGDVTITAAGAGLIVTTPDGTRTFRIRVNDDGDLVTEEIV